MTASRIAVLPVCKEAGPSRSFLGGEEGTVSPWEPTGPIETGATLASASTAASRSASAGILGMASPALSAPPPWSTFEDATPLPSIVDIFLLALLCGSLVGTVRAAVYRLRSPQT